MPRVVGHVGRHGRGGDCPEGSGLPLSPGRPVARLAQAQAEAHPDHHGDGRIVRADHLGRLGLGRDAGVPLHAPTDGGRRGDPSGRPCASWGAFGREDW